jgi:hypothetical protein
MNSLPPEERWLVDGKFLTLWPYTRQLENEATLVKPMILFPDIFLESFGLSIESEAIQQLLSNEKSAQWSGVDPYLMDAEMESSISLARAMGALVTPHLHDGVSHILCHLIPGYEEKQFQISPNFGVDDQDDYIRAQPEAIFRFSRHALRLIDRLKCLRSTCFMKQVTLISPSWVTSKWLTDSCGQDNSSSANESILS